MSKNNKYLNNSFLLTNVNDSIIKKLIKKFNLTKKEKNSLLKDKNNFNFILILNNELILMNKPIINKFKKEIFFEEKENDFIIKHIIHTNIYPDGVIACEIEHYQDGIILEEYGKETKSPQEELIEVFDLAMKKQYYMKKIFWE